MYKQIKATLSFYEVCHTNQPSKNKSIIQRNRRDFLIPSNITARAHFFLHHILRISQTAASTCRDVIQGKQCSTAVCALLYCVFFVSVCTASDLSITRYIPSANSPSPFQWCTGIFFIKNTQWVVSLKNSTLFYRDQGEDHFSPVDLELNQPHSIAYNPRDGIYYLVDTDNHRLWYGRDLKDSSTLKTVANLAGIALKRPHDVLVDPGSGWVYVLNPAPVQLIRFKEIGDREQFMDLSATLVYARSLTLVDGKIYVVGAASGKIVEIDDFLNNEIKVYSSPGKKLIKSSGNWLRTGLIPDDLAFYEGFWYVTSYFHKESCAKIPCDYDKNKFIRFASWQDFEHGSWQDLSALLPSGLVPYFLTVHGGALYVAVFNHSFPGRGDAVYRIETEQAN